MKRQALLKSEIPGMEPRRGKVRDIYDFGDTLLIVTTDRISAFDWVLPDGILDKGRVLTGLSEMWFNVLDVPHHMLTTDLAQIPLPRGTDTDALEGRSMLVKKTRVVPVECVVRGYLSGSGWKEYRQNGTVCGLQLPERLKESSKLPEPIFTPATKVETGHDENISFKQMRKILKEDTLAQYLKDMSISLYVKGAEQALKQRIIIADTKFEFGRLKGGEVLLIDEVLTPDSSRFWPRNGYRPGKSPSSYDKQFVRNHLETVRWDKNSPPPELPEQIMKKTREKYVKAYEKLTGNTFPWN